MGALTLLKSPARKNYINHRVGDQVAGMLFAEFIRTSTERRVRRISQGHIRNIETLLFHIENFCEINEVELFTNSVTSEFLDDFIAYLEARELKKTYIKGLIDMAKGFVKRAAFYGYKVDASFDEVDLDAESASTVYLSMNEITRIYYYIGLTKFQERIRDLFVVGCLTALRYSDYSTLTPDNFQSDYIVKVTKKTGKKVIVPIHDYVREIYTKYNGEVSPGLSIQHFNRYIKLICKKIGIKDSIVINYTKGGKLVTETKEKWEMISSHTARRSAATNMYLTGRLKTYEIMNVTGHSTESAFFKYIRVTNEDTARRVMGDSFFRK